MIRILKPLAILLENVKALTARTWDRDQKIWLQAQLWAILAQLIGLGYVAGYKLVDSQQFAVPHRRWRVYIVGVRKDIFTNGSRPWEHAVYSPSDPVQLSQRQFSTNIMEAASRIIQKDILESDSWMDVLAMSCHFHAEFDSWHGLITSNPDMLSPHVHIETGKPREKLTTRQRTMVKVYEDSCKAKGLPNPMDPTNDFFFDVHNSNKRALEKNTGATTCIRPESIIYSVRHERYLTPAELFGFQGIYKEDFPGMDDVAFTSKKFKMDLIGKLYVATWGNRCEGKGRTK